MDNQNSIKRFLTKKNIFIVLGIVIAAELVWAAMALFKPSSPTEVVTQSVESIRPTAIILSSDKSQMKVGDKFSVSVTFSSSKKSDAADIILNFDPDALSVDVSSGVPLVVGGIYGDYPVNAVDETLGKISVSGISTTTGGTETNGLFGTVSFVAKKAGPTSIYLDFTRGSTVDSNITGTEEAADILEEVVNVEINIAP